LNEVRNRRFERPGATVRDDIEQQVMYFWPPVEGIPGHIPIPGISYHANDGQFCRFRRNVMTGIVIPNVLMIRYAVLDNGIKRLAARLMHVYEHELFGDDHL
jgi:hypothetical protein